MSQFIIFQIYHAFRNKTNWSDILFELVACFQHNYKGPLVTQGNFI